MGSVEPVVERERKVYSVSAFNRGVARALGKLPAIWIEGEVTELRRNEAWVNVFLTLKDPKTGATLKVTISRRTFDRLDLRLAEDVQPPALHPRGLVLVQGGFGRIGHMRGVRSH